MTKTGLLIVLGITLSFTASAQEGTGQSTGLELDLADTGGIIVGTVGAGVEVGPTPAVSLAGVDTDTTDDDLAVDLGAMATLGSFGSIIAGDNVFSVSTSFVDATDQHHSTGSLTNLDVLVDLTGVLPDLLTVTADALSNSSSVTGACGAGGTNDLTEAATTSITNLSVNVLGVSILAGANGSAAVDIDLSTFAGLAGLGVTGHVRVNQTTLTDLGAGSGMAAATAIDIQVDAVGNLVGVGNTASASLLVLDNDAAVDCMTVPVELMSFEIG